MRYSPLLLISSLALAAASPVQPRSVDIERRSGIQWVPCGLNTSLDIQTLPARPILCGSLDVPLDYTDPNCTTTTSLYAFKIPAATNSSGKSILFNQGGPGLPSIALFSGLGARLQKIVGDDHDLITWMPRGTGGDWNYTCFANDTARLAYNNEFPFALGNSSNVADGNLWMNQGVLAQSCASVQAQNGSLVGTAFVARDAMAIVDALNEDGKIRFWGFSYGSVLGSTIAAMFPDRIDRLIIDGVVNVLEYYHNFALTQRQDSDGTLMGLAQGCAGNPANCPLAGNKTATEIYSFIQSFLEGLKQSPVAIPSVDGTYIPVEYSAVKEYIYGNLEDPYTWPSTSSLIADMASGNFSAAETVLGSLSSVDPAFNDKLVGIKCSDTFPRASSLQQITPYLGSLRTSFMGGDIEDQLVTSCAQWPFAAKERYSGNFNVTTKNPPLVIGNTWDPSTAIASARNVSSLLQGSVLLEQHGYGHASIAQPSLCTVKAVRAYFTNGTLPQPGTICSVDSVLFSDDTLTGDTGVWTSVLQQLG